MYEENQEKKDITSLRRLLKQSLDTTRGGSETRERSNWHNECVQEKESNGIIRERPKGSYSVIGIDMEDLERTSNYSNQAVHVSSEGKTYKMHGSKPKVEYNLGLIKALNDTTQE